MRARLYQPWERLVIRWVLLTGKGSDGASGSTTAGPFCRAVTVARTGCIGAVSPSRSSPDMKLSPELVGFGRCFATLALLGLAVVLAVHSIVIVLRILGL